MEILRTRTGLGDLRLSDWFPNIVEPLAGLVFHVRKSWIELSITSNIVIRI